MSSDSASKNLSEASPRFMTTRWTVMGGAGELSRRDAAWDHFCAAYWYPVYSFIRRRGDSPEDALVRLGDEPRVQPELHHGLLRFARIPKRS